MSDSAKHPGLKQLRAALIGRICTGGTCTVTPESLGIYYRKTNEKEATFINLADANNDELEALNKACQPATFGRGTEDVLDETYRKAGKMDLTNFVSSFERSSSGIMDIVRADIVEGYNEKSKTVRADLYKLNIYDKGSFFKAHKDTPRASNMFASLVIVFPTSHEGGSLILRHKGQEWTFDSTSAGKSEVGYIAFYSDVEHEVLPVTSGYRVTLTYNLYFEDVSEIGLSNDKLLTAADVLDTPCKAALQELLSDSSFLPQGGRLGFGLYHQYPYDTQSSPSLNNIIKFLKGSDATLYRVCKDLELDTDIRVLYSRPYVKSEVLLSHFIHLGDQIEGNIVNMLRDEYGGEVVRRDYEDEDDEDEDEDVPEFVWATPKTKFNRVKENYIAYGNEASTEVMYGDICLIVEIGDYALRWAEQSSEGGYRNALAVRQQNESTKSSRK